MVRAERRSSANVSDAVTRPPPVASTIGRLVVEDGLEHVAFEAAIVRLAVEREELGQAQVGGLLDAAVELDEGHAKAARETPSDCRLAGAAQAEQRDDQVGPLRRQRDERGGRDLERAGHVGQPAHGDVAAPRLELHQEAGRDARTLRDFAQRPAALQPTGARTLPERSQQVWGHGRHYITQALAASRERPFPQSVLAPTCAARMSAMLGRDGGTMRHAH